MAHFFKKAIKDFVNCLFCHFIETFKTFSASVEVSPNDHHQHHHYTNLPGAILSALGVPNYTENFCKFISWSILGPKKFVLWDPGHWEVMYLQEMFEIEVFHM